MDYTWHFKNGLLGRIGHVKRIFLFFCVGALLLGIPGKTLAEEETGDYILEDTVVTATKTGETNLQETPMSISVFSNEFLKSSNADRLTELSQFVPNAQFAFFGPFMSGHIRGIGSENIFLGGEQSVAMYLDGVYLGKGFGANADFFDVERIEVLRGPQGTLYGRNATGGALNIITKGPSDDFKLKIGVEAGDFSKRRVDCSISGPLVKDKIKASLAFSDSKRDGFISNLTGPDPFDEDYTGLRGKIQLMPMDRVEIRLGADYRKSDNNGSALKLLSDQGVIGMIAGMSGVPRSQLIPEDFWDVAYSKHQNDEIENWGVSANVKIELSQKMNIHSISAYRVFDRSYALEIDGTLLELGASVTDEKVKQFSQEFQFNATWDRLKCLLGLYYYYSEDDFPASDAELDIIAPGQEFVFGANHKTDAYAAFGNIIYDFTDMLSVEAGARFSYEKQKMDYSQFATIPTPGWPDDNLDLDDSWDAFTPKFGVNYRPTDEVFLFGTISRGFKSGTFAPQNAIGFEKSLDPEFLWSYEAGVKTDWFGKRLRVNGTFFYYDYEDLQVDGFSQGWVFKSNAAEATSQGMEIEVIAKPIPSITLNGSVSYLDATYDDFMTADADGNPVDASGNALSFSPEWKIVFGAQYVVEVGGYGFLTARGDITWNDDYYFTALEEEMLMNKDYMLVNALIRFETSDGRWSVEAFGKNMTEEEYFQGGLSFPTSLDAIGQIAPPRTFGVRVVFNY